MSHMPHSDDQVDYNLHVIPIMCKLLGTSRQYLTLTAVDATTAPGFAHWR